MTELWQSPTGRYHWQQMCSAGAGQRNRKVQVPDTILAPLEWGNPKSKLCRCAIGVRDKARARIEKEER